MDGAGLPGDGIDHGTGPPSFQFISVDPVFELDDPQSWNGYTYADDDPVGKSDPSGLKPDECGPGGSASTCDASYGHGNYEDTYGGNGTGASIIGSPGAVTSVLSGWRITAPDIVFYNKAWAYAQHQMPQGKAPDFGCSKLGASPDCFYLQPFTIDLFMNFLCKRAGISCQQLGPGAVRRSTDALADDGLLTSHEGGGGNEPILGSRPPVRGLGHLPDVPGICGVNSFIAGTSVLLANGEQKPIEKIKVGDRVVATDPTTGKTQAEPVIASFGGTNYTSLIKITVDTDGERGSKTGAIIATEHHKFWNPVTRTWTRADHLIYHATLRAKSSKPVRVLTATRLSGHPTVHDLTIAGFHTYYVEAGATPVLVHNTDGCGPIYENPGHHDPTGGPNPYNPAKAVLPADAEERFANSAQVGNTRWAKIGSGRKAVYYRYFQHSDETWHWSGSSNGVTKSGKSVPIPLNDIPIQVRRG